MALLDAVYNATTTDMKKYECQQLKNEISGELARFRVKLEKFIAHPTEGGRADMVHSTADESVFAAFKRGMLRALLGVGLRTPVLMLYNRNVK